MSLLFSPDSRMRWQEVDCERASSHALSDGSYLFRMGAMKIIRLQAALVSQLRNISSAAKCDFGPHFPMIDKARYVPL